MPERYRADARRWPASFRRGDDEGNRVQANADIALVPGKRARAVTPASRP
jgi:hypothetical protein